MGSTSEPNPLLPEVTDALGLSDERQSSLHGARKAGLNPVVRLEVPGFGTVAWLGTTPVFFTNNHWWIVGGRAFPGGPYRSVTPPLGHGR